MITSGSGEGGVDEGMDEKEEEHGGEEDGSCPTHGWVGRHEPFEELESEKSASGHK